MKITPFTTFHTGLGAKMVPFAGFNMPVEYSGINDEHITVRERLGVFDVSHMGEFRVCGPRAMDFLQYITSNDVSALLDGKVQYSCFPNGKGGIVDDLLVYRIREDDYMMVVNAANIEKDWAWCVSHSEKFEIVPGRDLINLSDETAQLAVQGPFAMKAMQKLASEDIEGMENYTFKILEFAGIRNAILSTTGYTGSGGCEIYVRNEDGNALWKSVFEAGKEFGIKPAGLGARNTLRLEMGYCLYGNDIDESTSPIEAGLGWITKFENYKEFIDKQLLLKQKSEGTARRLKGFIVSDRAIPRQHYDVADSSGRVIGQVTSGTMSPTLKQGIGLAYLPPDYWKAGSEIFIRIRNRDFKSVVTNLPFYRGD